ncbi:MAG: alpha/beta fold hydrolase, partial [Bacteroidota bacterium]
MDFSDYRPHFLLRSGNANTIFSDLKRKRQQEFPYKRKRLNTPDGDFIDVDYYRGGNPRIAYILHGLESSSHGSYVLGMAQVLKEQGWDIAAINYRSCSGEINRTRRIYYAGATDDVDFVLRDFVEDYEEVAMVGFSFGGSLTMRYGGEQKVALHPHIKALVAIS